MRLSKRSSLAVLAGLSFALTGAVFFDIGEDWLVQNNPLWSTVAENALPLLLVGSLLYAAWYFSQGSHDRAYVSTVTKWAVTGAVVMLAVASWVVGLQLFQGQLKPQIIVVQTTIIGAVAGLLVGYNTAQLQETTSVMERERDRFAALFENDPAAIADVAFTADGLRIETVNDSFGATFDFEGKAEGRSLFGLVDERESKRSAIIDHVERSDQYEAETTLSTSSGARHFTGYVVPYSDDVRAFVIYQDITEVKTAQRRLEQTNSRLERSNDQLQQFAYVASHDLQEPIRMVSSYVDLLAEEYEGELDDEADEYIEFAVDGADRMQAMIDDLLQYSRVRTKAEPFSDVDTQEVFDNVTRDLMLLVDEASATVTSGDLPTVTGDANQLGQLFRNLIENAIEHGGDPPEVHVSAEERADDVVFSVSDNGDGVAEDQQERIFEIFEQGARETGGTGIGLAVCQRIVNRHGGDLWVDSDSDGATFSFAIPHDPPKESTQSELEL